MPQPLSFTASVLQDGRLAHYNITTSGNGIYTAHLLHFEGGSLPRRLEMFSEGGAWTSSEGAQELADALGYAINMKLKSLTAVSA